MLALEFFLETADLLDAFCVALDEDPEFLRSVVVVVREIFRNMTSSMFTVGMPALYWKPGGAFLGLLPPP